MSLERERPKAEYTCSQGALYIGLRKAWNSQKDHQPEFEAENTKYTVGFEIPKLAEVEAASELPDGQARYADAEAYRVTLVRKNELCLGFWNSLDGYVHDAFGPSGAYKARIEEAGKLHYIKALNKNWESSDRLLVAAKKFMTKYNAQLTTPGGMPPTFVANFLTKIGEFDTTYVLFKKAEDDAKEQTDEKINADNSIYKKGRHMMEDGKHIFRENPAVRELFIWENILATISTHRNPEEPPEPTDPPVE